MYPLKCELYIALAGTRFQAAGNTDEAKDVVPEHEDKTDCVGHHHCSNPHHYLVCLPWLQMLGVLDSCKSHVYSILPVDRSIFLLLPAAAAAFKCSHICPFTT